MNMKEHETRVRVRYAETDQMGVVYYGQYSVYYEVGRAEWLRQYGLSYADIENMGILMPVTKMSGRFIRPAYYDQLLTLRTKMKDIPGRRITFVTEIFNDNGELLNIGEVTLAFLNRQSGEVVEIPKSLSEKLLSNNP